jgi:hypothetical protein
LHKIGKTEKTAPGKAIKTIKTTHTEATTINTGGIITTWTSTKTNIRSLSDQAFFMGIFGLCPRVMTSYEAISILYRAALHGCLSESGFTEFKN